MLRSNWVVIVLLVLAGELIAFGQATTRRGLNSPAISSVFPPGGTRGQTVEWTIRGRVLANTKGVTISGAGVKVVDYRPSSDAIAVVTVAIEASAIPGFRELRVDGPDGVSNFVVVRVDELPQGLEVEPNDDPSNPQTMSLESVIAGTIRPTDVDVFRVVASPGTTITVDLEARRLGTSISPVVTILNQQGRAIIQIRETRSPEHDGRLGVKVPADGIVVIQVRDNIYSGGEGGVYRLRVTAAPFATGVFPRGGPPGKPLTITLVGGSLDHPISRTITLPDDSGSLVDLSSFEISTGRYDGLGLVLVGEPNDLTETVKGEVQALALEQAVNACISARSEVDRYSLKVKKGQKFRIKAIARTLGSWLDSVVVLRNQAGMVVAENDDLGLVENLQQRRQFILPGAPVVVAETDSQLDYEATKDDTLTIEVTDRYGEGGPEYAYRLEVGLTRPDFEIKASTGNPGGNQSAQRSGQFGLTSNQGGLLNLVPGGQVTIGVTVTPTGFPGPVRLTVEGLPPDVVADPVTVSFASKLEAEKGSARNAAPRTETVIVRAPLYAMPSLSSIQIIGTAEVAPKKVVRRVATAEVGIESSANDGAPVQQFMVRVPSLRRLSRFPLKVIGESRYRFVGPPQPPRLLNIKVPGVLLVGERLDLGLEFDTSPLSDPHFEFEARAKGVGLATNTVILSSTTVPDSDGENSSDVLVRVLASQNAVPGVYPITIRYKMSGGVWVSQDVSVIVRAPIEVLCSPEPITIKPGVSISLWVGVRRQFGVDGEIDVKLEGLPRGVRMGEPLTLAAGQTEGVIKLVMSPQASRLTRPSSLRVLGVVRMSRGSLSVESGNRPMIRGEMVDEKGRGRIE